jgi:hypothetical protein
MLHEVRNAIAHTNGRIKMLREKSKRKIFDWEKQRIGIEVSWGYIVVNRAFVEKVFFNVQVSLENLVMRYKQWDASQVNAQ